jgi:hypothetical protein
MTVVQRVAGVHTAGGGRVVWLASTSAAPCMTSFLVLCTHTRFLYAVSYTQTQAHHNCYSVIQDPRQKGGA